MLSEAFEGEDESVAESSSAIGNDETPLSKGAKKKLKKRRKTTDKDDTTASTKRKAEKDEPAASAQEAASTEAGQNSDPSMLPAAAHAASPNAPAARPVTKPKKTTVNSKRGGFTFEQLQLLALMMKMILQMSQNSRDVMGTVFDTWLAPADDSVINAMTVQGRRYALVVRTAGHGLSSPHLYVFGSMLDAIAKHTKEEEDRLMNERYIAMSIEQRAQLVRLWKIAKVFKTEDRKLALAFGAGQEAQACKARVLAVLAKQQAWTYKVGRAPASHMERQLSEFLGDMIE